MHAACVCVSASAASGFAHSGKSLCVSRNRARRCSIVCQAQDTDKKSTINKGLGGLGDVLGPIGLTVGKSLKPEVSSGSPERVPAALERAPSLPAVGPGQAVAVCGWVGGWVGGGGGAWWLCTPQ
jgi:hypothetical protein